MGFGLPSNEIRAGYRLPLEGVFCNRPSWTSEVVAVLASGLGFLILYGFTSDDFGAEAWAEFPFLGPKVSVSSGGVVGDRSGDSVASSLSNMEAAATDFLLEDRVCKVRRLGRSIGWSGVFRLFVTEGVVGRVEIAADSGPGIVEAPRRYCFDADMLQRFDIRSRLLADGRGQDFNRFARGASRTYHMDDSLMPSDSYEPSERLKQII